MKMKLQAGMEIDMITPAEMSAALEADRKAWQGEIARGIDFKDIALTGVKNGAVWSLDLSNVLQQQRRDMGPSAGFVWSITRLYVSGTGVVAGTDLFSIYTDEVSATKLVASGLTRGKEWNLGGLVLAESRTLAFSGAATGAGSDIWVAGQAVQMPRQLMWQLLGK